MGFRHELRGRARSGRQRLIEVFGSFPPQFPAADDPCRLVDGNPSVTSVEDLRCDVNEDIATNVSAPGVRLLASIDGEPIADLFAYCAQSNPGGFDVVIPENSVLGLDPGPRSPVVADGSFLLFRPLSPGVHTLHIGLDAPVEPEGEVPVIERETFYTLLIGPFVH